MHFVICVFVSLIIFATSVLFTEIFPKWFKALLILLSSYTTGYAIMILLRKIAMLTKAFKKPWIFPGVWIAGGCTLAFIILVKLILRSRAKKKQAKEEVEEVKEEAVA